MSGPIVQHLRTGRDWGDKRDPKRGSAKVGSATVAWEEFDHWDGPTEPGGKGEYIRATQITGLGKMEWPK